MIETLNTLKQQIETAGRATRDDILAALQLIKQDNPDKYSEVRDLEISELVENIYNADQTAKLLTSLDSYDV